MYNLKIILINRNMMIKHNNSLLLLFLLTFFINNSFSQDFNSDYLESLPEDIKQDVLDRADEDSKQDRKSYREEKLSSKIKKERELSKLKIKLEEDLKELEIILNKTEDKKFNELALFGEDFFDSIQTTFMPTGEPNLDSSYVIDFGDELEIQIIGQTNKTNEYFVNRDGSINIDGIGKIFISGLSMNSASELIKTKINKTFIGATAFISLINLRDLNIMISGNAYKPGIYTIAGGSNMLQALSIAGGIGEHGSYRDIVLIRNNEVIERLDIYDVLINGIFSARTRLKSGDVILVKPVHNIVSVDGAVKRPGKYELLKDENLQTALDFANSINIDADLKNITLKRILDGNMEIIKIVNLRQFENINSVDGDAITIRRHPFRSVKISGAVLNPGTYSMSVGDTLRDLINKAGGYTQNAYPFGAIYENNDALEINEEAKDILYVEFIDNIISTSQQNPAGTNGTDLKAIIEITKELKNASPNGRIVVDLLNEDSGTKFYIKDKDKLHIPEKPNHVYVFGEVSREGSVLFKEQNFNYYLNKSGGLKSTADKEAIFVLHPNGNTQRYKLNKNIFASSPQEVILYPGSIIFVPRNVDDSVVRTLSAQAYVSILGNLGIALASLSNLNN